MSTKTLTEIMKADNTDLTLIELAIKYNTALKTATLKVQNMQYSIEYEKIFSYKMPSKPVDIEALLSYSKNI